MRRLTTETERVALTVESLENRMLLAGNVRVTLNEGTLKIIGDTRDNCVEIDTRRGDLRIQGCSKTDINGRNRDFTTNGKVRNVEITLDQGNDRLNIHDVDIAGNVSVHMNEGRDRMDVDRVNIKGDVDIGMGQENDALSVRRSSADHVSIDGKDDRDEFKDRGKNDFSRLVCQSFEKGCKE